MATIKFTVPAIKSLPTPSARQATYFDENMPRFGLTVFTSGKKSFFIKYTNQYGKSKMLTIGKFPEITLEQARTKARELLAQVALGNDPQADKIHKRHALSVAEVCDWYLRDGVAHKKESTIKNDKGRIETLIKPLIGHIPIEILTPGDVNNMMLDIIKGDKIRKTEKTNNPHGMRIVKGGRGAAARTHQTLGAILSFAKLQGLITDIPTRSVRKPKDQTRDIFLTRDEIRKLGHALAMPEIMLRHPQACDIIRLLLLTGCRRNEVLELQWQYVDFENQLFRFPDTKTGKQNRPFGKAALTLLRQLEQKKSDSDWVFPASRGLGFATNVLKPLKRILKTTTPDGKRILDKPELTLHALRHTFASLGADLGYSEIIISALIGHHSGSVTNRYTHTVDKTIIKVADAISQTIQELLDAGEKQANQ